MEDQETTRKTRPAKIVHCHVSNGNLTSLGTNGDFSTLNEALSMLEPLLAKACTSSKKRQLRIGVFLEDQEEAGPYSVIEIQVRPSKSRQGRQDAEKKARQDTT